MKVDTGSDGKRVARTAARTVAAVAALFVVVVTTLLVATWIQLTVHDPLDNPSLVALREAYAKGNATPVLRNGIRTLDLQARRAYFSNYAQLRLGSYMAFGGVLVLLLALRLVAALTVTPPAPSSCPGDSTAWRDAAWARRLIGAGGLLCLAVAVTAAYFTEQSHFTDVEEPEAVQPPDAPPPGPAADPAPTPVPRPVPVQPTEGDETPDAPATALPDLPVVPDSPAPECWCGFRGPNGLGVARTADAPTTWDGKSGSNILWKIKVPRAGFSSPVVWENRVFLTGADNDAREVYAFDTTTGALLWRGEVKSPPFLKELPEVSEDTGYAAPTMATDGQRVYAVFATGDIAAFTLDGKQVWSRNLGVPDNHYGHSSSLIVHDDHVLVQFDHNKESRVISIEAATGRTAWETPRNVKISWASPVMAPVSNRLELILVSNPDVVSYDPSSGKELWRVRCMGGEVGPSPAYADGTVFAANEYAKLVALDPVKKLILWENEDDLPDTSSPVATPEFLFTASSGGVLTCYDAKTGTIHWKHELDEGFYSSVIVAGDRVYVPDLSGVTHIFRAASTFEMIAQPALGEPSVCTPAFVRDRIYMRGMAHLYCIGKTAKTEESPTP